MLAQNLAAITNLISETEKECGRAPGSVLLLAVSKQQPAAVIAEAYALGQQHFGENYYQEALEKMHALQKLPLIWHFIGPIQTNKAKGIAQDFTWVHSVNRLKVAQALSQHRPPQLGPLNILLQVNIEPEPTKSGMSVQDVAALAIEINQLPHLKLRGLMTIPPPNKTVQQSYALFCDLKQLMLQINQDLALDMDTLSMGMSDDMVPAIQAGATIVRIGRAIFGERS